jgi:hypothetical protein
VQKKNRYYGYNKLKDCLGRREEKIREENRTENKRREDKRTEQKTREENRKEDKRSQTAHRLEHNWQYTHCWFFEVPDAP